MVGDFAICDSQNINHLNINALPCWRNTHQIALVGATQGLTCHNLVLVCHLIVNESMQIGQRGEKHGELHFYSLAIRWQPWWGTVILEIGRQIVVHSGEVVTSLDLFNETTNESQVSFGRHRLIPFFM